VTHSTSLHQCAPKIAQCSSKFGTNLLDQEQRHSTAALVCKRFLHLTRSPQLLKCVYYRGFFSDFEAIFRANKFDSLLEMLRDNKQIRKLTLEKRCNVLEILKVVAPHDSLCSLFVRGLTFETVFRRLRAFKRTRQMGLNFFLIFKKNF
jgi:hypothetical protein